MGHQATKKKPKHNAAVGGNQQLRSDSLNVSQEASEKSDLHGVEAGNCLGEQPPRLINHRIQLFSFNPLVAAGGTVCLHQRDHCVSGVQETDINTASSAWCEEADFHNIPFKSSNFRHS